MPPPKKVFDKRVDKRERGTDGWLNHEHHQTLRLRENELFNTYYRDTQRLCPDAESFEKFLTQMRTTLPTTLWINHTDPLAPEVASFMEQYEDKVEPIPWYPIERMGWRIHLDKTELRKDPDPKIQALRQYLIRQTAMGTISRQEEVSMVPTFLLEIKSTDKCLDMCASPGSKTAQMLAALGAHKQVPFSSDASPFPFDYLSEGMVVANELDHKRANMLVHQVKRLRSLFPFAMFTNHDARYFPELNETADEANPVRFDKILCDVVCSGDGTMRKAPHFFKSWQPREALKLQKTQVQIALRAAHLLTVGGRMVYSTCSLNPIENEAAVAQIARRTGGSLRLIDARSVLPKLPCDPGMTTWKVTDNRGNVIDGPNENFNAAFFPADDVPDLDLTKCMRFLPHHCNGGGFFVAVFEKVAPWSINQLHADRDKQPASPAAESDVPAQEGDEPVKVRVPPTFIPSPAEMVSCIDTFYGVKNFPLENLVCRTATESAELVVTPSTSSLLVSNTVRDVLRHKSKKVLVVSAGLRVLAHESLTKGWRISCEAASLFTKLMSNSDRVIRIDVEMLKKMIAGGSLKDVAFEDIEDEKLRSKLDEMPIGAVLVIVEAAHAPDGHLATMALRARTRFQLQVDAEDLVALQLRLNLSVSAENATRAGTIVE